MAGGAYIKIKDGNIYIHAPGTIEHKGAAHPFMGPTKISYPLPSLIKKDPLTKDCLKKAANSGSAYVLR
jgi:type VI secretion system secreted protein VgrG